ncbi:MAG: hypothetical protein Q9175_001183 [Cornicularia normoerica]
MSNIGAQAGLILQQVAQEASKAAKLPNGFEIYEEEKDSQDPSTKSITNIPEQDLQRLPENCSLIAATSATPTISLAAIAGDTAMEGDAGYGIVPFPDLEEGRQDLDDNAISWVGATIGGESLRGSQQNEAPSVVETEQHQIQAFAKLEFDDGEFYMNTYAVEIGRDVHAARQAADLQARQDTETKSRKRSASAGGSITSSKIRHRNGQNMASSVASESGGVIAVDNYESEPTRKPRSRKPKSWSSSSQQLSRKSSMLLSNGKTDYNALAMASLMGHDLGADGFFGPNSLLPAPELVPLVPIHPPALPEGAPSGGKSISRKHIRIAYNFEESLFEVEILGRNGGFVDDEWYAQGDVQTLMNGSIIQIGGVGIRFVLPDVAPGETGAEIGLGSDPLSGGKMSFDMAESIEDDSDDDVDEDEERGRTRNIKSEEEVEKEEEEEVEDEVEDEPEAVRIRAKGKKKPEPEPLQVTKRKGPGRPPKNGVISKREQVLLARQAREDAKVVADRGSGAQLDRGQVKAGKNTKTVKKEEPLLQANGKRKYTKRKRAGGTNDQRVVRESTEQTDSVPPEQSIAAVLPPKPAKEKKPPKPPRSPSPVFDEATLTPEQLAKPTQNYIVLIHEALSNSETGAMALPQIYRSMQRRYPYFKLRATTLGWQSSVRHNLSQNAAFRKIERDGKGWMWGLVPGVSIEREKKKRATPPPVSQQPYYPPGPPPIQYPYSYPGMPPPNGRMPPNPYVIPPGMPTTYMPHGLPPRGPHGFPLPLVNAQSESTYQSPYQSTPPPQQSSAPAPQPQQNSNTNGANGHYPTPTSQPPVQASDKKHQTFGPAQSPSPASNQPKAEALTGSSGESPSNTHGQDAVDHIARFKSDFIESMPDKAKAEDLVKSAIDRTLSASPSKDTADEAEDPKEKALISKLATTLRDLSERNMEIKRRASDAIPPPSKASPAPTNDDADSSLPAAASKAAEIGVKSAFANGDAYRSNSTVGKEAAAGKGSGKRQFENGDSDGVTDHGQPEAKRVAIEA